MILALDTTNAHGSIALAEGERLIEEVPLHAPDGYSEILFGAIADLLARHAVVVTDVSLFAAASGPGTFTGVRVGLACVKGLAEALGRPVCAVSNLQALATFGVRELRAVTLDARREEIYAAVYDSEGEARLPEHLTTMAEFQQAVLGFEDLEWIEPAGPLGAAIARIAARRLRAGDVSDPAQIEANYIRRSDAELHLTAQLSSLPRR